MKRTAKQSCKRLDEIAEHGFIDRWEYVYGEGVVIYAGAQYGPYTLDQLRAWLEGVDAMGVGGAL